MERVLAACLLFTAVAVAAPEVVIVRDLTKVPNGSYEIVQTYDQKVKSTLERPGKEKENEAPRRTWNTITYELVVKQPVATVTMKRIQIIVEGKQKLTYDSAGPADAQTGFIREQFFRLIGKTAKVDLAAFGKGAGFKGLDVAFEEYVKANPDKAKWGESNRRNYGDARVDRIFLRGIDVLFGADAGRATGKSRTLKQEQALDTKLKRRGIGWEPVTPEQLCEVQSIAGGKAVINLSWTVNGTKPKVGEGGKITVRGADIASETTYTYHAASGLLVGMEEVIRRRDQVAAGMPPTQRTWFTDEKSTLTIKKKG